MVDVRRIVVGRAARGFADGFVSILLARYLVHLGFGPFRVGVIVTGTLLGSAALTLVFGLLATRATLTTLLLAACALMVATGVAFASITAFWPLLLVAVVGTLNPSAGDVSVFLPTEQAFIAGQVASDVRTRTYAIYNLGAVFAGAVGALASGLPEWIARTGGWAPASIERFGFVGYALIGVGLFAWYRPLRHAEEPTAARDDHEGQAPHRVLSTSRRIVVGLSLLFSIDSAGSGFVVTSLLVIWLHLRFDLSSSATAAVFFAAGLLGACSQLAAPVLAARIGMVRTMAYTHIPANLMLIGAAFAPSGGFAITLLLGRALFAQMDNPARQAFVMAVVPAEERAAAASITNVPRSLASALTPMAAGALLSMTDFGWPLVIGGVTKLVYDCTLLALHRNTPESTVTTTS